MSGRHRAPSDDGTESRRTPIVVALAVVTIVAVAVGVFLVLQRDHGGPSPAAPPTTRSRADIEARLNASFDALRFRTPVGVAIVPVGGGTPLLFGDQTVHDAWSTIKAPLGLAAERKHGMSRTEANAVVDSDNNSARILTKSLGTPTEASEALADVLREGGDTVTVPPPHRGSTHPMLGETQWSLADSGTWTANLPCMTGSDHILELMRDVADVQEWGVRRLGDERTAVKGGWGPDADGGYVVRQIGVVTLHDGSQVAVSASIHTPRMTFEAGTATLDKVAEWLQAEFDSLPGGRCH
ncbi:hypothetical protein SAMN04488550_2827 [Gordonia malaquae]|uniref:Uncharacterized protein n=1 Tax=Gordonia malaquae NBRC 108250 TaxID=1223542 RepID=M3VDT4_GORML|nr:hypothetical protein [Gordonia malaquae]GAC78704.1 hypothetical protein GM1_004_01490 [Gordonia malaquae NBRC 108250]SED61252.1 hypothetical protein SAMN04488550_2827 [Gordonia malaquae]